MISVLSCSKPVRIAAISSVAALVLLPSALAFAADISGYLEEAARRETQQAVSTNLEQISNQARAGNAEAQYQLGLAHRHGWELKRDAVSAATWLREAADQGHTRAQYALGSMYETGEGVPVSLEKAKTWYATSAASGLPEARQALARVIRRQSEAATGQ